MTEVDGAVVAFTAAIVRGDAWFLSAMFVDPDHQGRGIGRRLLEFASASWPVRRMTISDAIQPVSNSIYIRAGLIPAAPILVLGGTPSVERPADIEPDATNEDDLAALDLAAYGFDRRIDHAYWATHAAGTLWRRQSVPIAYSYVSARGWLGPLAGRDETSAADALRAELSRMEKVTLEIPGSAPLLIETAFGAGLRITNPPGLLLHSRPAQLPRSLVISGYFFM